MGRENLLVYSLCLFFSFFLFKDPSLVSFHIDGINETLQQRLLKYFSASETAPRFHVALVQDFSVTPEKLPPLGQISR